MHQHIMALQGLFYEIIAILQVLGNVFVFRILQVDPLVGIQLEGDNSFLEGPLLVHVGIHDTQSSCDPIGLQYFRFEGTHRAQVQVSMWLIIGGHSHNMVAHVGIYG